MRNFRGVSEVIVVQEDGSEEIFPIQEGDHKLRVRFQDRFSSWSLGNFMPVYKFDRSEHRVYYRVENNARGLGWNGWGYVVGIDASLDDRTLGLCSSRNSRRNVLEKVTSFSADSFDFLKDTD